MNDVILLKASNELMLLKASDVIAENITVLGLVNGCNWIKVSTLVDNWFRALPFSGYDKSLLFMGLF